MTLGSNQKRNVQRQVRRYPTLADETLIIKVILRLVGSLAL